LRENEGMTEPAIAYLRTSSAANVRHDSDVSRRERDSDTRQREAIQRYASAAGLDIVAEFYHAAVSGTDPIDQRDGFTSFSGSGARERRSTDRQRGKRSPRHRFNGC
jgi:hypothetical protein